MLSVTNNGIFLDIFNKHKDWVLKEVMATVSHSWSSLASINQTSKWSSHRSDISYQSQFQSLNFSPYQQTCNLCPQSCASPCWLQRACGGLGPFAGESCAVGSSCLCCTQTSSAVFHKLMRCWQWWLFHVVLWPRRGFICRRKYQSFVKASMREMSRRKSCWYVCFSHAALLVSGFRPWMPFSLSMYFLFVKLHALI